MPYAMLGAIPPRRTTRSSTRNDRDTLCNGSAMSCSAKRPGKCIRWSVAIEPVTAILMTVLWVDGIGRPSDYRPRSEEHTSELQSRGQRVCRHLLENKTRVK